MLAERHRNALILCLFTIGWFILGFGLSWTFFKEAAVDLIGSARTGFLCTGAFFAIFGLNAVYFEIRHSLNSQNKNYRQVSVVSIKELLATGFMLTILFGLALIGVYYNSEDPLQAIATVATLIMLIGMGGSTTFGVYLIGVAMLRIYSKIKQMPLL